MNSFVFPTKVNIAIESSLTQLKKTFISSEFFTVLRLLRNQFQNVEILPLIRSSSILG